MFRTMREYSNAWGDYREVVVYDDDDIDDIYRRLSYLHNDIRAKIAELEKLLKEKKAESDALHKREGEAEPDSEEWLEASEALHESYVEESALERAIDSLEKLLPQDE